MNLIKKTFLPLFLGNCILVSSAFAQSPEIDFDEPAAANAGGRTHTVVPGDTLWGLSGTYLGDNAYWPTLWSYNPQVTNPHWIYPGDVLNLSGNMPAPKGKPAVGPQRLITRVLKREFVPLLALLSEDDVKSYGEIMASPRDANMLRPGDKVWLTMKKDAPKEAKVGDYYVVYHETDDNIPNDEIGDFSPYTVCGVIQITELAPTEGSPYIGGKIVFANREIERGDLLLPYERQATNVKIRPANTDLVGKIIYSVTPRSQLADRNYLFINKGSEDGVQAGNRFFVYQAGDLYRLDQNNEIPDVPMLRVGQLLVVSVMEHTSLTVVIDSTKEFVVGDRIEMYKCY